MNDRERTTVDKMIHIYCTAKHGTSDQLCAQCSELQQYASKRLEKCFFGEEKPVCKKCPVHCYKQDMKIRMQEVMRFSGPRMIYRSPFLAIVHLAKSFKRVPQISK